MLCSMKWMERFLRPVTRALWLAGAIALAAPPLRAADVTFLVNENASATTVYLRTNATHLGPVLGLDPDLLWSEDEGLDYGTLKLRLDARAAELWPQLGITLPDRATVAPMGLVMHPSAQPVPFDTPFAASIAAAVCVTPTEPVAPRDALELYAGFVLRGAGEGDLLWTMAEGSSAPVTVQITQFAAGERVSARQIVVTPGEPVALRGQDSTSPGGPFLTALFSAFALAVLCLWAWRRRHPIRTEHP